MTALGNAAVPAPYQTSFEDISIGVPVARWVPQRLHRPPTIQPQPPTTGTSLFCALETRLNDGARLPATASGSENFTQLHAEDLTGCAAVAFTVLQACFAGEAASRHHSSARVTSMVLSPGVNVRRSSMPTTVAVANAASVGASRQARSIAKATAAAIPTKRKQFLRQAPISPGRARFPGAL